MTVIRLPPRPSNDPGMEMVVTVSGPTGDLFRIGGGANVLCPFDPDEYDRTIAALKTALCFLDNEALTPSSEDTP